MQAKQSKSKPAQPKGRALTKRQKDAAVEAALFEKAVGKTVQQQDSYKCKRIEYDDKGKKCREEEYVEVCDVEKVLPPEMAAIAMWLKGSLPEKWGEHPAPAPQPVRIVDDVPQQSPQEAR